MSNLPCDGINRFTKSKGIPQAVYLSECKFLPDVKSGDFRSAYEIGL